MQSAVQESGGFNNENQDVQIPELNTIPQIIKIKSEDTGVPKRKS